MLFFFNFLKIFGLVGVAADLLLLLPVYYLAKEYFCWLLLLLLVVERRRCFLSPLAILVSKVVVVVVLFKSNFKFTHPSPFDLRKYTSVSLSLCFPRVIKQSFTQSSTCRVIPPPGSPGPTPAPL
jgi:hypothetical protein